MVEINESDLDFQITNLNITKKGSIANKAKSILKKSLRDEIVKLLKDLTQ